ncbi:hypothetical protein K402DRAFT_350459 [Aulographum hederae CBS 113979]|uniref:Zn(2)-C6 fungal-type domain-containing protein n=1 Tax=Aulographum hederae CBS 113979 TaxID=1176131 RepID=A0A6G1H8X8_9PEZI|nr:hypothetical protein K402DRAFT_350459 [Aulographum hederae CBS 113979]
MAEKEAKKHSACDACRSRKLKCSGDNPKCVRCQQDEIECVYSTQKRMGRPRKRARDSEGDENTLENEERSKSPDIAATAGPMRDTSSQYLHYIIPGIGNTDYGAMEFPALPNLDPAASVAWAGSPAYQDLMSSIPYPASGPPYPPASHNEDSPMDDYNYSSYTDGIRITTSSSSTSPPANPQTSDPQPPCACLSNAYLTLSAITTLTDLAFPFVLGPIRRALATASGILHCEICFQEQRSGMMNTSLISMLLSSIGELFKRALDALNAEAARCEGAGEKKEFQMGDASVQNLHMHTGAPDCPGKFVVELEPAEWKMLASKAVKVEILRPASEMRNGLPSLRALVEGLEQRQRKMHMDPNSLANAVELCGDHGTTADEARKGEFNCLRQLNMVRDMIEMLAKR